MTIRDHQSAYSEAERFLLDFHRRHPGATPESLGWGRTEDGRSSYDLLVAPTLLAPHGATVLDLCCGDGHLLGAIAAKRSDLRLVGVDFSSAELELGHQSVGGRARFLRGKAQSLPLASASVDCVVSHMALMLLDDVERVVAEVARVLLPGGAFAAVVGAPLRGGAFELFVELLRSAFAAEGGSRLSLGDRRTRSEAGLRALFAEDAGFEQPISVSELVLDLTADESDVWACLALTYDLRFLSEEGVDRLKQEFSRRVPRQPDGRVPCAMGLRLAEGVRRA